MLICPTIYRPDNVRRFVECYKATGATLPVFMVFDAANYHHYNYVGFPENFTKYIVAPGMRLGEIFNHIFEKYPNEPFYGMVADDVVPETYEWDKKLFYACQPDKIAWGFDGGNDETLIRHPFIGGALVRQLGYWSAPGVKHWFVDNAWRDIADALNCGVYLPDVRMKHYHHTNGLALRDRAYESQPDPIADRIAYAIWRERELPGITQKFVSRSEASSVV